MKPINLEGLRYGMLVVVGFAGRGGWRNKRRIWLCRCDCGKEHKASTSNLQWGQTLSCGCRLTSNTRGYKHGFAPDDRPSPEYIAYHQAKQRCNNPKSQSYRRYGGRGIKFLFDSFPQFIEHIGLRPDGRVLDRIDNDGNYELGNVRWATPSQSLYNTSRSLANRRETRMSGCR